jgi:hypothetical protein
MSDDRDYKHVMDVRINAVEQRIDDRFKEIERRFRDDISTPLREIAQRFEAAHQGTQTTGRWLIGMIVVVALTAAGSIVSQVRELEHLETATRQHEVEIADMAKRLSVAEHRPCQ